MVSSLYRGCWLVFPTPYQSFISFLIGLFRSTSGYINQLGFYFVLFLTYYSVECQTKSLSSIYVFVSLWFRFFWLYILQDDFVWKTIKTGFYSPICAVFCFWPSDSMNCQGFWTLQHINTLFKIYSALSNLHWHLSLLTTSQ